MTTSLLKSTAYKALEALTGELALTEYTLVRIDAHAKQYQGIVSYQPNAMAAVLFSLLHLVAIRELKDGNTVVWLNDTNDTAEQTFAPLNAPIWTKQLLSQIWQAMAENFDEPIFDDYLPTFIATAHAFHTQSPSEMAQAVQAFITAIGQRLGAMGLAMAHLTTINTLILLSFRLCYLVFKQSLTSTDKLRSYLLATPFFMAVSSTQALPLVLGNLQDKEQGDGLSIWLYRSYLAEIQLAGQLKRLLTQKNSQKSAPTFDETGLNPEQKQAVSTALSHHFTIIAGGPGTGKTFTVARLVMALLSQNHRLSLALSAPTGKAAQRMQESLQLAVGQSSTKHTPIDKMQENLATFKLPEAMTIHRLLAMGIDGIPQYDSDTPLPYEVIVVDEASMLGVELSAKLFSAVKSGSRLILLGDNHQLSAVEAGRVLADLCQLDGLDAHHVRLTESRRFSGRSGIGQLATLVNHPDEQILDKLRTLFDNFNELTWQPKYDPKTLIAPYLPYFDAVRAYFKRIPSESQVLDLFKVLNRYRILCVGHQGKVGDEAINRTIALAHLNHGKRELYHYLPTWYHGRVIMITKNHYNLGLFNGDVGICLRQKQGFTVYFDGKPTPIAAALLPEESVVSSYAITVHKSQGSEFDKVAICLDDSQDRLLSRELLYTAITRAKTHLTLYASESAVWQAVSHPTLRNTGLHLVYGEMT